MNGNELDIMEDKMDKMYNICPICGSPLRDDFTKPKEYMWRYDCYRCGKFKILTTGISALNGQISGIELNDITKIYISGWIRENQGSNIIIDSKIMESLMSLPELSMFEKADKMLQYLAEQFPVAGTYLGYNFTEVYGILEKIKIRRVPDENTQNGREFFKNILVLLPLIAIGRIINGHEFSFLFSQYLEDTKQYISKGSPKYITPAGWAYLETFRHPNPDSKKAFVAMWFDEKMEEIYDSHLRKAVEKAGFKPIQIGRKEHNNDINDEIIGEIRSSKFVVADFTGNRGGVYYEAGFAHGLNLEVIHTCQEDQLKDVHFDINHRNIIKWKDGEDLYNKLLNRIKATIV